MVVKRSKQSLTSLLFFVLLLSSSLFFSFLIWNIYIIDIFATKVKKHLCFVWQGMSFRVVYL